MSQIAKSERPDQTDASKRAPSATSLQSGAQDSLVAQCEAFIKLVRPFGIRTQPFTDRSKEIALRMDEVRATETLRQFQTICELYEKAIRRDLDIKDTRQLTWWAVKELGLRPPSDFFDKIEKADVVECYDSNQVQVFRSLSFFEFCTYDVLSVLTRPWHELYGRNIALNQKALNEMFEILERGESTLPFTLPLHRLWEVDSAEKREFIMNHRFRAPLFDPQSKLRAGIIMTSRVEIIAE